MNITLLKSKWLPLGIFGLIHILILMWLFTAGVYGTRSSADGLFYGYASFTLKGVVPYRDFGMEYPPLALLFFLIPRLISSDFPVYMNLFTVEMLIFDLIGLWVIYDISEKFKMSPLATLTVYTLAILCIGPLIIDRYDLVPAIMVLLAIYSYIKGRTNVAFAMLALGTMTKLYPAVVAPIFLIDLWQRRRFRDMGLGVFIFAAIVGVILLPFLILAPNNILGFLNYHTGRELQVESLYSSFLLLGNYFGIAPLQVVFGSGSWNITSTLANFLASISLPLTGLSLLGIYWAYLRNSRRFGRLSMHGIMNYSLASVLVFMLASKVLSPQFIIWILPMIPLVTGRFRYVSWFIFIVIALMTLFIFPANYLLLINLQPAEVFVLFERNLLLIVLAILVLINPKHRDDILGEPETQNNVAVSRFGGPS